MDKLHRSIGSDSSLTSTGYKETWLIHWMNVIFLLIGRFVANYALFILIFMSIFTVVASSSIFFTSTEDNVRKSYTPRGARSHHEVAVYQQFFRTEGEPTIVYVFILANDGANLLTVDHLNATVHLIDFLANNVAVEKDGKYWGFSQFCTTFCYINEPIRKFYNAYTVQHDRVTNGEEPNFRLRLDYPLVTILGRNMSIARYFFGVKMYTNHSFAARVRRASNIEKVHLILAQFRVSRPRQSVNSQLLDRWQKTMVDYLKHNYSNRWVHAMGLTDEVINQGIVDTGLSIIPYIFVGFLFMLVFSLVTVSLNAIYMGQYTWYKPVLALVTCISPLFACSTALGLLFRFGFRFGSILFVTPFLVLAIGVDDAFLMIHSWQRYKVSSPSSFSSSSTSLSESMANRLGHVLAEVGPSISITSLTNALAFAVGIFTPTPEMQLFCAATALGMIFDFIYQIFVFAPFLALIGRREIADEHRRKRTRIVVVSDGNTDLNLDSSPFVVILHTKFAYFINCYSRWLASNFTLFMLLIVLLPYWYVSIVGMLKIEAKLTPDKLLLKDSLITQMNNLREKYIWPNYTMATVFVNNPGDLSNPVQLSRTNSLVEELEKLPESHGSIGTKYWIRDYRQYVDNVNYEYDYENYDDDDNSTDVQLGEEDQQGRLSMEHLGSFFDSPEFHYWKAFVVYDNDTLLNQLIVRRFFMTVAFRGQQLSSWNVRADLLNSWRSVVDKYPDLDADVYEDDAHFLDQIESLCSGAFQTAVITLICMAIVCTMFMWNVSSVFVACFAIVSITVGVFGMLSWWNVDLDPISMATTIMSIGFSVDFVAHITYHYHRTETEQFPPIDRLHISLSAVGWPMFQAGLSTIIAVSAMAFVDTHMTHVFVKTVLLVVFLGVIHGLTVVPALMTFLSYKRWCCPSVDDSNDSSASSGKTDSTDCGTSAKKWLGSPYWRQMFVVDNKVRPEQKRTG